MSPVLCAFEKRLPLYTVHKEVLSTVHMLNKHLLIKHTKPYNFLVQTHTVILNI